MHPKKAFLLSTLFMILFPLFYRISILDNSISFFEFDSLFRKIVLTRLDSIAYGLLAAWTFYYYQALWLKYKNQLLIVGIFTLIFAINYIPEFSSFYLQVLYFCVSPISVMLILPFAIGIKNQSGIIAKSITHISKISYSMYLINFSCIVEVMMKNFPPQNSNDSILKYGIYWFLVITISSLLYKYFEKPIMDLRDKNLLNKIKYQ
jgi:peptidoglycan/LPS O-acetylase OafA/YrhL